MSRNCDDCKNFLDEADFPGGIKNARSHRKWLLQMKKKGELGSERVKDINYCYDRWYGANSSCPELAIVPLEEQDIIDHGKMPLAKYVGPAPGPEPDRPLNLRFITPNYSIPRGLTPPRVQRESLAIVPYKTREKSPQRMSPSPRRKIKTKSPKRKRKSKACVSGKIRNSDTGRCVDRDGRVGQRIRGCPGKVLNPPSRNCVSRSGSVGLYILGCRDRSKIANHKTKRCVNRKSRSGRRIAGCGRSRVRNPASGRCVKRTSKLGRKILS